MENEDSLQIGPVDEDLFWNNEDHWHLLDGYTENEFDADGNLQSKPRVKTILQDISVR